MRLILFLGVVLKFLVPIAEGLYSRNIINCSFVPENLYISEVMPIKYDVNILIKPHQRILLGYVNILIKVTKSTNNITLHAEPTYNYDATDNPFGAPYSLTDFQFCTKKEVLILKFDKTIDVGMYQFKITYRSVFTKRMKKIFYSAIETHESRNWMLTNLYSPNAIRTLFPCWDDPRVKATYNISIRVPADYTVLSNIPEKSSFSIKAPMLTRFGVKFMQYEEFVSMPTHMIAFLIVNDIAQDYEGRDIHYMWHKTDADKKFTHVLEMAQRVTSFFSQFMKLGSSYFFSKINHVVFPNSPMKSMGVPGLVVYRERDIAFDEVLNFPGRSLDVMTLVTYEMARQLFVSVVSPQSRIDYIWLNEIFASFYNYFIIDKIQSSDRLMELFVVKFIQPALNNDMLLETEAIIHKAKNSDGIDGLLYPLLYHKKAFALIRMLFKLYNPETFKEAIRNYVHARENDVWTILEEAHSLKFESDSTVKQIMNTWLTTKHHPEMFIQRDYQKWSAACISYMARTIEGNPKWIIPVNYIIESSYDSYNISEVLWLKWGQVKNITAISGDDFLIVNAEQTGFYRVNYDNRNWLLIWSYLQKNNFSHIPPINRAQLLNDAYYFTITSQLDPYIFTNITKYLTLDTDFVAWYPMFNILSDMSIYFKFNESRYMRERFLKILSGILTKVKYEEVSSENNMQKSFRYLVRRWACKLGPSVCRRNAFDRLMIYINHQDELDRIPAISKEWILCDGLKLDDLNVWKNILNKSIHYNNMELLEYLSCTENSSIILEYLTLMLRSNYFSKLEQSMEPICRKIVKNHIRKIIVLRFVIDNYSAIVRRFDFPPGILLSDMIMNVYSLDHLDMIQEFATSLYFPNMGISILVQLLESINLLISHQKRYLIDVLYKFKMFHNLK
ncbi:thyrotropin-releasing hormone-degrading ectoenzyme-like [Odontomachus brunneus]|uniref:thyrotropin-releasing hormone-degrading ectoenzyme-like n=1 Tax=Odontomachus brunneus TaxID=486640 RepID=UPI0013F29608|nr:thyrotropin-releasing hormone-degrading ectoenzyme-like [Odontomachus brunneus]